MRFPDRAADHAALGRLWARARIHQFDRQLHDGQRDDVKEQIVALALRHRLMTAWTSLVAVDSSISNPTGVSIPVGVPVEMPQGVSYEGVFGAARSALSQSLAPPSASPAPPAAKYMDRTAAEEKVLTLAPGVARAPVPPMARNFTRLTLVRADGTRLVLEDDGELWQIEPQRRTLPARLTAADLDTLRAAIGAAVPEGWSGREAGSRLVLEATGRQWTVNLPSTAPGIAELVALLEARAR